MPTLQEGSAFTANAGIYTIYNDLYGWVKVIEPCCERIGCKLLNFKQEGLIKNVVI